VYKLKQKRLKKVVSFDGKKIAEAPAKRCTLCPDRLIRPWWRNWYLVNYFSFVVVGLKIWYFLCLILCDLQHVLLSCCKVTCKTVDVKRQRLSVNYIATKHTALHETRTGSPKVNLAFCQLEGDHIPMPQLHMALVCIWRDYARDGQL